MWSEWKGIEFPQIELKHCSTQAHCESLQAQRTLPFWWYQALSRSGPHFSLPFQDKLGNWWYQVRPGFAWPVDIFQPITRRTQLPYRRSYLGFQHVVSADEPTNSTLVINTITDLSRYGPGSISDKRRNAIRKGGRCCEVLAVEQVEKRWLQGVVKAWNDLVDRTGWKNHRDVDMLRESWTQLLELPAANILLAIDKETGEVAGFLIIKIHGGTAYVDTIASNSELMKSNPNDILMYTFLRNAQRLPGVKMVHFAIKSNVEQLEKFKTSLGFEHQPFPARLHARPGLMQLLRLLRPQLYRRLTGQI